MDLMRRVWRKANFGASYASDVLDRHEGSAPHHEANVVCSDLRTNETECRCKECGALRDKPRDDSSHFPVIDLDVPVSLVLSTTEGHYHLYIDYPVRWDNYCTLLDALVRCGLVEHGYAARSKERGYTAVRLPWVKKGDRGI